MKNDLATACRICVTEIKSFFIKMVKGLLILLFRLLGIIFHNRKLSETTSNFITGESFVIKKVLRKYIKTDKPVFFDVGSNEGFYSSDLQSAFPKAEIYAFEANSNTLKKIPEYIRDTHIQFFNLGLASSTGNGILYDYKDNPGSEHASVYKEVMTGIHKDNNYLKIEFKKDTIDNFCREHNIKRIDFIKIDTEGSEFDVLKGASQMLGANGINIIQFEFNSMNVISRTFLKDYYDLLRGYSIFRLEFFGLVPLPNYKPENEIFKYQNFLALNKEILGMRKL